MNVINDITGEKRAEEALLETEEWYEAIFEVAYPVEHGRTYFDYGPCLIPERDNSEFSEILTRCSPVPRSSTLRSPLH